MGVEVRNTINVHCVLLQKCSYETELFTMNIQRLYIT